MNWDEVEAWDKAMDDVNWNLNVVRPSAFRQSIEILRTDNLDFLSKKWSI